MIKSKLDHKYTEGVEWVGLMTRKIRTGKVEGGEGIESQYI